MLAESIICGPNVNDVAVVVPAHPYPCTYIRVVRFDRFVVDGDLRPRVREIAYWDSAEWKDDPIHWCIGAIAGAIKRVNDGSPFSSEDDRKREEANEWEDWT